MRYRTCSTRRRRPGCSSGVGMPERHAGRLDPPLGPGDALGHRRLRHQEGAGDLGRGQAADRSQRQRDRRRRGQRRVAAHEQHDQRVVLARPTGSRAGRLPAARRSASRGAGGTARCAAGRSAAGSAVRISQPRGSAGIAVARPVVGRGEQRLLDGVLGGVEVAGSAGERAEDLRRELAQQVLDIGRDVQRPPPTCLAGRPPSRRRPTATWSITCRTWIGCWVASAARTRHGRDPAPRSRSRAPPTPRRRSGSRPATP